MKENVFLGKPKMEALTVTRYKCNVVSLVLFCKIADMKNGYSLQFFNENKAALYLKEPVSFLNTLTHNMAIDKVRLGRKTYYLTS